MILFAKLFKESAFFALGSIAANKLRTLLTLLGITIGIFAIISVFSVVDALEREIRASIASMGENVVYIEKWPWGGGGEYAWWRYMNRPTVKPSELDEVLRRTPSAEIGVFIAFTSRTIEYQNRSIANVSIMATSHDYDQARSFELRQGRYFSPLESSAGRNVVILGDVIASNLFGDFDVVGKQVKVFGRKVEVIGVLAKEGSSAFDNSHDEMVIMPVNFINTFIDVGSDRYSPRIMVKARNGVENEQLIDELTATMRAIRRIKPTGDDNFALNETNLLSRQFDGLFRILKITGWIIGGFSILVGGFGIANIMFVSVRERTSIIGIQKALGAKNYFILLQFLMEAILLSFLGGAIGLVLVLLLTWIATEASNMNLLLSPANVLLGVNVSVIIGLVSGFIPAWTASRLDPVEAIRSNG